MEHRLDYEILVLGSTFYKDGKEIFSYYIEYLKFDKDTPEFNQINLKNYQDALARQAYAVHQLYQYALQDYALGASLPYVYISCVHITMNQNGIFSGYFENYMYSGGAHGNLIRTAFTFDSQTGKPRTLCSFMKQPNCLPCITQYIIQQIRNSGHESDYFSDYVTLVPQTLHAENFYIKPQGVVVFFEHYDIAPYVSGIKEFVIPFYYC